MNTRASCVLVALSLLLALGAAGQSNPLPEEFEAAQRAMASRNFDEAERVLQKIAAQNPGIAEVHGNLGLIYFEQQKFEQAIPELQRAVKLKPALTNSVVLLALSLAEVGQYQKALPGLEKGFDSSSPQLSRLCGLQLERAFTVLHLDGKAAEVALAMEERYPNDPEVQYNDGKILSNFGATTTQKIGQSAPDSIWTHQAAAEALESQGSHEAAIAQYKDVLSRDPQKSGIHYRIGRIFLTRSRANNSADDLENAKSEFKTELELHPADSRAAYEMAEINRGAGQFEDARTYFELALKYHPDFEEAQLGFAATLMAMQKPGLAIEHLEKALSLNSDDEVAWWRLSQAQHLLGNLAEQKKALAEFQRLHSRSNPQQPWQQVSSSDEVTPQQLDSGQR